MNATVKKIGVKSNGPLTRLSGVSNATMETVYRLELEGPLLPNSTCELCELFKVTQHGEFTANFKNDESCAGFNILGDVPKLKEKVITKVLCAKDKFIMGLSSNA